MGGKVSLCLPLNKKMIDLPSSICKPSLCCKTKGRASLFQLHSSVKGGGTEKLYTITMCFFLPKGSLSMRERHDTYEPTADSRMSTLFTTTDG